jgi:hypothetical protein
MADTVGVLLENLRPGGRAKVRLEDGTGSTVVMPLLGFDLSRPAGLEAGTVVRLHWDSFEDCYWCLGVVTS